MPLSPPRAALPAILILLAALGGLRQTLAAQTVNPHGALPQGVTCIACHTEESWLPLRAEPDFDHGKASSFVLDGRHADLVCASCHGGPVFGALDVAPADCAGCHEDIHRDAYPRECTSCHTTNSFTELRTSIVHPADFPLEGVHLQLTCEHCHAEDTGGGYTGYDGECVTCHGKDVGRSVVVDHVALGLSTDCGTCHSQFDWLDVFSLDHAEVSAGFQLLDRHQLLDCAACHTPAGTPIFAASDPGDCAACHQSDWQRQHASEGVPTECAFCHEGDVWSAVVFDHDAQYFPIYSGAHRASWGTCSECHAVPSDFGSITCMACHAEASTRDRHTGVRGFEADTPSCLTCHPTGNRQH